MTISVDVGMLVSVASGVPVPPNGTIVGGVLVRKGVTVFVVSTMGVEVA